jgi:hypothetical protein
MFVSCGAEDRTVIVWNYSKQLSMLHCEFARTPGSGVRVGTPFEVAATRPTNQTRVLTRLACPALRCLCPGSFTSIGPGTRSDCQQPMALRVWRPGKQLFKVLQRRVTPAHPERVPMKKVFWPYLAPMLRNKEKVIKTIDDRSAQ